jgi:radical SAM superfamily enzyme YgiQ (UPF0313 family)
MRISFVNPPYKTIYKNVSGASGIIPPLGIAEIATYIRNQGYKPTIIDANALDLSIDETVQAIADTQPEIVGITATTASFNIASEIISKYKTIYPSVLSIVGGVHASTSAEEILNDNLHFDIVVSGEGEKAFEQIIESYASGDFSNIPGVSHRNKDKQIVLFKVATENLYVNDLCSPAFDLLPMEKYQLPSHHSGFGKKVPSQPFFMIFTGRGCPMNCHFCASHTVWGNKVRFKSAEQVINEIDTLVNEYKVKVFDFADDIFTINKTRLHEILNTIINRNYKIHFNCSSRADTLTTKDLELLKKAGCYLIRFGLESGSQTILNLMNKRLDLEKSISTVKLTHKFKIATSASYILGYPGETKETALETIKFAKKLKTSVSLFFFAIPYKGTYLYEYAIKNNLGINKNPKYWINFPDKPVLDIPDLSADELIAIRKKAYRTVLFNFGALYRNLIKIRDFKTLFKHIKSAGSILHLLFLKNQK